MVLIKDTRIHLLSFGSHFALSTQLQLQSRVKQRKINSFYRKRKFYYFNY